MSERLLSLGRIVKVKDKQWQPRSYSPDKAPWNFLNWDIH